VKLIFYAKYLPKSHKSNKATFCEKERRREEEMWERDGEFPGKREGEWGKRRRTHLLLDNFDSGPAFGLPSNLLATLLFLLGFLPLFRSLYPRLPRSAEV